MILTCGIFADKLKTMTTFKDFSNSGMLEKHPTNVTLHFGILVSISSKKLQNQAFQECCNKQPTTNNAAPLFGIVHDVNGPLKIQNQGFQITPKLKRGEKVCEEALYAMVF